MNVSGAEVQYSFKESHNGLANDGLKAYPEELRDLIEDRGDYIIDSYEKLREVVNLAFDKPNMKATAYFGIIEPNTLNKIKNSVPNLPKELDNALFKEGKDYSVAATLDSIRHIADEKSLTREDVVDYLDRFADTILGFDNVTYDVYVDSAGQKNKGLLFRKRFDDGTLASFNLVSNKKRTLSLVTLYLKSADYQKKKFAETLPLQKTTAHTPKAGVGQTSSNIIPDFPEKVNSEVKYSRKSGGEDIDSEENLRYNKKNSYTDDEYHAFGWARENDILTATENSDLRSKFAAAVTGQSKPPKSKSGEYMISVGEDVENKIAYMKGTIDNPVITRVLEIEIQNETKLDEIRRETYALERRGIQQKTGGIFNTYTSASFGSSEYKQGVLLGSERRNNKLGIVGIGSGRKASRIKEIIFGDDGEIISEVKYSRKTVPESISEGNIHKRVAEWEKLKVYEKRDAEKMINGILTSVLPPPNLFQTANYLVTKPPQSKFRSSAAASVQRTPRMTPNFRLFAA